jgi:hypothetical protein
MRKAEIIERLEAEGIDHDPKALKAELEALLPVDEPNAVNYTPPTTAKPTVAAPTPKGSKRDIARQVIDAGKSDLTFSTLVGLYTVDELLELLES